MRCYVGTLYLSRTFFYNSDAQKQHHGVAGFWERARHTLRICGPYVNLEEAFIAGARVFASGITKLPLDGTQYVFLPLVHVG